MEYKDNEIKHIAEKYFDGSISYDEETRLFDFVMQSQGNKRLFDRWEREWIEKGGNRSATNEEWNRLMTKMQIREAVRNRFDKYDEHKHTRHLRITRTIGGVAAAVALVVGTIGISKYIDARTQPELFIVETNAAEQSKIYLPDGTEVWLNACTKLSYTSDFNKKNRDIRLDGEAYFEVEKNEGKEFRIDMDDCSVTVKGTKFNIMAYEDEHSVTAALVEGSLQFDSKTISKTLVPDQAITLNTSTGEVDLSEVRADQYSSWIEGRIDYDSITLDELFRRLSRRFDVDIVFNAEQTSDRTFCISLNNGETVYEILDALKLIVPITTQKMGKSIVVEIEQ